MSSVPGEVQLSEQWTTEAAYEWCRRQTGHYENFTKGSFLFPRRKRPFLNAVYAFARYSDDLADESPPGTESENRFNSWRMKVANLEQHHREHPILCAIRDTIQQNKIPLYLFTDLLEAFGRDFTIFRYEKFEDLTDYCRYSANPVGRIVLRLFGVRDDACDLFSDKICSGLQLVNFLQDVVPDAERGHIYLPMTWVREAGVEQALLAGDYSHDWQEPHELLAVEAERLLKSGRQLIPLVPRRLRLELKLFIGGGEAALQKVINCAYNPTRPHHLSTREKTVVALRAIFS